MPLAVIARVLGDPAGKRGPLARHLWSSVRHPAAIRMARLRFTSSLRVLFRDLNKARLKKMERRDNERMRVEVERALALLTDREHDQAVRLMWQANAPVEVISRVIFLRHKRRRWRRDQLTARKYDIARAVLKLGGLRDAEQYLALARLPAELADRALHATDHRRR